MFGLDRPLFTGSALSRGANGFHDEWEAWAKSVRDKPYESEWAEAEVWAQKQREDALNRAETRAERLLGA